MVYWPARLTNASAKVVLSDEHVDFKWGTLNETLELITEYPDMCRTLKEVEEYLKQSDGK